MFLEKGKVYNVLLAYINHSTPFTTQSKVQTNVKKNPFENIVGKGENARNQIFFPFKNSLFVKVLSSTYNSTKLLQKC